MGTSRQQTNGGLGSNLPAATNVVKLGRKEGWAKFIAYEVGRLSSYVMLLEDILQTIELYTFNMSGGPFLGTPSPRTITAQAVSVGRTVIAIVVDMIAGNSSKKCVSHAQKRENQR